MPKALSGTRRDDVDAAGQEQCWFEVGVKKKKRKKGENVLEKEVTVKQG